MTEEKLSIKSRADIMGDFSHSKSVRVRVVEWNFVELKAYCEHAIERMPVKFNDQTTHFQDWDS